MRRLGLIGAGNMGSAILRGMLDANYIKPSQVVVCDSSRRRMEELSEEIPTATYCDSAVDLVEQCDMVILAVKPHFIQGVIDEVREVLDGKAIISIAAGWTVSMLAEALEGTSATYLRVMPNTPAMVGEGMTALCDDSTFSKDDFAFAKGIFDAVGRTVIMPERLFDGVIAISGSSPAYVFMLIEAMADGAVADGMPRAQAYKFAAQAVLGSAKMVLETGRHPGELKDMVCSPGGTTMEAVRVLEEKGLRSAIIEAEKACVSKSRGM